jgi:flagellar biosynthesis protein FliR
VFFAGMPLRAAVGLFAMLLSLAVAVGELPAAFRQAIAAASELLRGLAP